jgi:hypothetical protein
MVSQIEIDNAQKVLEYLSTMEDISFKNIREDIFEVSCDGLTCLVDVEETIVCLAMEVMDIPLTNSEDIEATHKKLHLYGFLLELNNEAIHGKFCINGDKIFMKDNLEFENLDKNELESSLAWIFAVVRKNIEKIASIVEGV